MVPWLKDKFIAHRGLHNDRYAENSLSAFKNAVDNGYNIELDVNMTKDGTLIVFHDNTLLRTAGRDVAVRDLTYSELQSGFRYATGDMIPSFFDVLELTEGRTGIMVEVKKPDEDGENVDIEPAVAEALHRYKGDFVVKSFNCFCVSYFRKNHADFMTGLLAWRTRLTDYPEASRAAAFKLLFGENGVAFYDCHYKMIGCEVYNAVREAGKDVIVWTVDSQEIYESVANNAENIIFENFIPQRI